MVGFVQGVAAGPGRRCRVARKCSARAVDYVTCDVDGTLLNSAHNVSPADAEAVTRALRKGVKFVTATGKSRQGSLNSIGPELENEIRSAYQGNVPGVFLQGIIVYGLDGEIVYEQPMDENIIRKVVKASRDHELTLVAYSGDHILCEVEDDETRKLAPYKEPTPQPIGRWEDVIGKTTIHKLMFLAPVEACESFRPVLEKVVGEEGRITQAMRDMIEILPPDVSKGYGVQRFLKSFNADPEKLLAIGDAENDLEMLKLAKYGVAMGNGFDSVKAVANDIVASNDEGGVAMALERYILGKEAPVVAAAAEHSPRAGA